MGFDDFRVLRDEMVDRLADAGYITTERIVEAFRTVPRHVFVPGVQPEKAYADEAIVTRWSLRGAQRSVAFEWAGDHLASVSIVACGFMPLRGTLAKPGSVRNLGVEPGLLLKLSDTRDVDTAALYAALRRPGEIFTTGVSVTRTEVMGGLDLWVALHDPDVGHLSALGGAADRGLAPAVVTFPGMALTTALLGKLGLAALVRADPIDLSAERFDVQVQHFGRAAGDLARRLVSHVHAWQAARRPSTAALHIRAYPRTLADSDSNPLVIDTEHARLLLDW